MGDGLEPVSLAMVICDAIHVDPSTGKRTLLGLFSVIFSREFPVVVPRMAVFVSFTECRGKIPVLIQIVDVNEERDPVEKIEGEVDFNDPLGVVEIDFRLTGIKFPESGEYRVQFLAAGELIGERRLLVVPPPTSGGTHE